MFYHVQGAGVRVTTTTDAEPPSAHAEVNPKNQRVGKEK